MKWYQRLHVKLILRVTKYTLLWVTLSLFLHASAWFLSGAAKYSLDRTAVDFLSGSLRILLGCAIIGIALGGPAGIALGSISAAVIKLGCRGQIRPMFVRLVLGIVVLAAILPAIQIMTETISMLHGDKARFIGLLMIVPLGLALHWSQLVAGKYIIENSQGETTEEALHPRKRMVLCATEYSVAIGVPLLTAYVWLYLTVADTWYTVDGPIFLMILICGTAGFAALGGLFGVIMSVVAKLAQGRIIDSARFRVFVSLAPLIVVAPLWLPTLSDSIEMFWQSFRFGFYTARLDAAGWLLAAATAMGICQIVVAKYQRETSPPKNDSPMALWQPIPLVKMVTTIVVCSVLFSMLSRFLYVGLAALETTSRLSEISYMMRVARDGISVGLIFASVLALTIMLGFSGVRRPNAYRFTMLGVTLIVAAALWSNDTQHQLALMLEHPDNRWRIIPVLAQIASIIIANVAMAEVYRRAVIAPFQKRAVSENEFPID